MTLIASVNYLSLEGLPWVLTAWLGLYVFRPFATLVHEFGHFWTALILTKDEIGLTVGKPNGNPWRVSKRVTFEFSFHKSDSGETLYSDEEIGLFPKMLILSGGPFFSLGMSCLAGWLILNFIHPVWLEITGVSWFCANCLAFLRASLPMRLRPTDKYPEGPPSDGLQLLWLFSGKGKKEET